MRITRDFHPIRLPGLLLTASMLVSLSVGTTLGQDPAAPAADATSAESKYAEMRKSRDRVTQQWAERYYNLVKLQEWVSDKGTKIKAKYVSHDPELKSITLATAKGNGADRVLKEVTVPVERLNKTGQSRVKQIDAAQKKLDQLAAQPSESGQPQPIESAPAPETSPTEDRPARRTRPARAPRRETPTADAAPSRPASSGSSSTADDGSPDPLGFGELSPASPAAISAPGAPSATPVATTSAASARMTGFKPKDKAPWRTDYQAFVASVSADPSRGRAEASWAGVPALQEAANTVKKWEDFGSVGEDAHREIAQKFTDVGEFSWEATLAESDVSSGDWTDRLALPALPEPLTIDFVLDPDQDPGSWQNLKTGDRVRFIGRFMDIESGSDLVVAIRFPGQQSPTAATSESGSSGPDR